MQTLPRRSRALEAYEALRSAILAAQIPAGEAVNEVHWAAQLGMSRTPVREALNRLSQEGLVETVPHRGTFVRGVSLDDLREVYQLREALEALAANDAVLRLSDADILRAEHDWTSLALSLESGERLDYETVGRLDNALHMMIVSHCDNGRLRSIMAGLNEEVLRYQLLTARILGDVNSTVEQHLALIGLLKRRDAAGLSEALRTHIENAADIIFTAR